MPKYTFTFKKDDIFVEFTTTDKETVERQFQIWVANADEYARNKGTGNREQGTEDAKMQGRKDAKMTEENLSAPQPLSSSAEQTSHVSHLTSHPSEPQPEILDQASTLLKTINTMQETGNGEVSLREESGTNLSASQPLTSSAETTPSAQFDKVLAQSIENPTFEPVKTQDKLFLNLVNSKNTSDKFHYLIITAYYLAEFEKLQRFSLKQINSKMMQNLSEVIDHATLQEAINQGFIEVVPDLTGISDVAEYKLTLSGEEFFANKI